MKLPHLKLRPVTETAVIALAYYCLARLGFMMALPLGKRRVLWLPSALALAATMEIHRDEEALRAIAESMVDQIRGAIDNSLVSLIAVEGLFAASTRVSRQDFEQFAGRLLSLNPTTYAISWRPRIGATE